jgi:predicted HTH domain antitoxin
MAIRDMQITLELPDEIGRQLGEGRDLSRAAFEALVAEGCREHRLSDHQAAQILGISRYELDGILKARGIYYDYTLEDFKRECEDGEILWKKQQAERAASPEPPK